MNDDKDEKPEELFEDEIEDFEAADSYQEASSDEIDENNDIENETLNDENNISGEVDDAVENNKTSENLTGEENPDDYDVLNAEESKKGDPEENKGAFINRNMIFLTVGGIILVFFFFSIFILPLLMKQKKPETNNALDKAGKIFIPDEYEEDELTDDDQRIFTDSNSAEDNNSNIDKNKTSIPAIDRARENNQAPVELPPNTISGVTGTGNQTVIQTNRNELQKEAHYIPLNKSTLFSNSGNNYPNSSSSGNGTGYGSYGSNNSPYGTGGQSYGQSYGSYAAGGQSYSQNYGQSLGPRYSSSVPSSLALQSMLGGNNYKNQNNQSGKEEFMNRGREGGAGNLQWNSDISLWKGTIIPAVLETGINTDNPGEVIATVTTNIYSSNDGRYILIPQGSRLFAEYNSDISYAQNRVQVAWNTLIRPDGLEIDLGSVNGVDTKGYSGYKGFKSEHPFEYAKAMGLIAIFSIIDTKANNMIDTNGNTYAQNAMSDMWQTQKNLNNKIIERALDVQPTIRIKSGTEVKLITNLTMEIPPLEPNPVTQKYVRY